MKVLSPAAARLVAILGERGIELQSRGHTLRFRPYSKVTPAILDGLRAHKCELSAMALIRQARDAGRDELAEALSEAWTERIAICVEDGKVSHELATQIALRQLQGIFEEQDIAPMQIVHRS